MQRHFPVNQPDPADLMWRDEPDMAVVAPAAGWPHFIAHPLPSFAPVIVDFVTALSARLQQAGRQHPDLAALGFWLRPRQIEAQRKRMAGRAPLGVVFHLVPSNVPTVAFYSWIMALLMGNGSVVRLSSRLDPVQEAMLTILNQLFALPEWQAIAARHRFVRYHHDEHTTAWLSQRCHLRIIWGGDETIRQIRAIPLSPRSQEAVFADRRSMAILDSQWLASLDSAKWQQMVAALQQDVTRFNQQACASPTTICWLGAPAEALRRRLLDALFAPFARDPALAMERLINSQQNVAADGAIRLERLEGVTLLTPATALRLAHIGGGTVAEFVATTLDELLSQPWDMQTCIWVGDDKEISTLENALLTTPACHIDRVAQPGQALSFDWFWDGIDMLATCSRQLKTPVK